MGNPNHSREAESCPTWLPESYPDFKQAGMKVVAITHLSNENFYNVVKGTAPNLSYDFTKLDRVIDPLVAEGITPLMGIGWNEPDPAAGTVNAAFWRGTKTDYNNFYGLTAKTLKNVDNTAKVGGPAITQGGWYWCDGADGMSTYLRNHTDVPFDFLSFHSYGPDLTFSLVDVAKSRLVAANRQGTPKIFIAEWNIAHLYNNAGAASDTNVDASYATPGNGAVGAFVTRDPSSNGKVSVLAWNDQADTDLTLRLTNLPFNQRVRVAQYVVDKNHGNHYLDYAEGLRGWKVGPYENSDAATNVQQRGPAPIPVGSRNLAQGRPVTTSPSVPAAWGRSRSTSTGR